MIAFGRYPLLIEFDDVGRACIYAKAAALAESLRATYSVSLLARPKKLGKALQRLEADGFAGYLVFGEGEEVKRF